MCDFTGIHMVSISYFRIEVILGWDVVALVFWPWFCHRMALLSQPYQARMRKAYPEKIVVMSALCIFATGRKMVAQATLGIEV